MNSKTYKLEEHDGDRAKMFKSPGGDKVGSIKYKTITEEEYKQHKQSIFGNANKASKNPSYNSKKLGVNFQQSVHSKLIMRKNHSRDNLNEVDPFNTIDDFDYEIKGGEKSHLSSDVHGGTDDPENLVMASHNINNIIHKRMDNSVNRLMQNQSGLNKSLKRQGSQIVQEMVDEEGQPLGRKQYVHIDSNQGKDDIFAEFNAKYNY